jgi:serine/threonine protein kinase/tetratricopeptide (TPR) repeat protein
MKMLDDWPRVKLVLEGALACEGADREAYLAKACGTDADLRAQIDILLAAGDRAGTFLETPAALLLAEPHIREDLLSAGAHVGTYTLLSPIGRGGMGTVWLAERSDGRFTGRVAVKLLNAALIGRAGEERFKREGTILARLTHPNIAHLIDAGVTSFGQPFLVLEHVEGDHIDRYCDARGLDVAARIRLFLEVLGAVEHAHANLIVHRDIKPSNVLARADGRVKLLDFGIAKLLEAGTQTADATLTIEAGLALTPEYAAPEQMTGGTVTTVTDVYALGVLLYVLLGGQHPAGGTTRRTPADLMKAIVEETPPRLSEMVTATTVSRDILAGNATKRGLTPEALRRVLRGDLDTIAARALKKGPEERYPSVGALADDLRRYLDHRPIAARPDTAAYRTRKFIRRNRVAVALATGAVVALVGGLVGTITQARRAGQQALVAERQRDFALRQLSRAEAINDLNQFVLSDAAPSGKPFTVGDLLARAERVVDRQQETDENQVEMLIAIGRQYAIQDREDDARRVLTRAYQLSRGLPDRANEAKAACALASSIADGEMAETRAEKLLQDAFAALPDEPQYFLHRVFCYQQGSIVARDFGDPRVGVERAEAANRLLRDARAASPLRQLRAAMNLAEAYRIAGRYADAHRAFADASTRLTALGRGDTETAGTLLNNWALTFVGMGQLLEAEPLYRRAIGISSADGTDEAVSPMLLNNLARTLADLHRMPAASHYAERAYEKARRIGNGYAVTLSLLSRAIVARGLGDFRGADRLLVEFEARLKATMPAGHVLFTVVDMQRSLLEQARGNLDAAMALADRAVAMVRVDDVRPRLLLMRSRLAIEMRRHDQARDDAEKALRGLQEAAESGMPSYLIGQAQLALGRALLAQGNATDAARALANAVAQLEPTLGVDHPDTKLARTLATTSATAAAVR